MTRGFRDLLEIGRLRLTDPTNYFVERIQPLVSRRHVREIDERLRADGSVLTPPDFAAATESARELMAEGVTTLAIVLMHSYRNPAHEEQLAEHLSRELPGLYICTSSQVWPQQREYERGLLTVINAYIGEKMSHYFSRLHDDMHSAGMTATLLTTKSNGGIMAASSAARAPVETLLSGPASGAMGALMTGRNSDNLRLIGFDMGGTSVDVAIIDDNILYSTGSQIGDFPLIMPAVDISSIGAGGGSIAWLDSAGVLKVGPQSAGSLPGPAAYGRGGHQPTVTDAYVRMGIYAPERVLGGGLTLDYEKANAALATLAEQLGLSTAEVAQSILDVTTANMYAQFMPLMANKGIDPRDFSLLAYGGGGPQHAFLLAREVGVNSVIVPAAPGTLCALGSLNADLQHDLIRTMPAGHPHATALAEAYADLVVQAEHWLTTQTIDTSARQMQLFADIRYHGQSFDLTVPLTDITFNETHLPQLIADFHQAYQRIYGFSDTAAAVEITNVRVTVRGILPKYPRPVINEHVPEGTPATPRENRIVTEEGEEVSAGFFERSQLLPGHAIFGPAVIEAADTTIWLPSDFTATIDPHGNLIGRLRQQGEAA